MTPKNEQNQSTLHNENDSSPSRWSGGGMVAGITRIPGEAAIILVRLYQYLISPWLGRTCRFYPSCSQYFILCVRKYGFVRAVWKGTGRICRCHPWHSGGYDPP